MKKKKEKKDSRLGRWVKPRWRLYSIYCELGYIPWHKEYKVRKARKKKDDDIYWGGRELIPFLNDDAKRTITQLIFRPGYMMRDYIRRGDHEHYLAPLTALLVFFSFFTLAQAVLNPTLSKKPLFEKGVRSENGVRIENGNTKITIEEEEEDEFVKPLEWIENVYYLTCLDKYPEMADTPWKKSLAALEGDLRSKGIPLFLSDFLVMWLLFWIALRKYKLSFSGAAALSAYVQCQFCLFQFLALLVTFGKNPKIGIIISGLLIALDLHQFLGEKFKKTFKLTLKIGLYYVAFIAVCILLISIFTLLLTKGAA